MQSDLSQTPQNREATNLALARHVAFASLFCSLVAILTALALDLTFLIPLLGVNAMAPFIDCNIHINPTKSVHISASMDVEKIV